MSNLMQILDFTEADLAANQAGHLSPRQRKRLYRRVLFNDIGSFVFGLILSWLVGIVLYFILPSGTVGLLIVILLALAIITALFGGVVIVYLIRLKRDIDENRALLLAGPIQLTAQRYSYWVECQQQQLWASRRIFAGFRDGEAYHIYYLPQSKLILSASEDEPSR